MGGVKIEVLKNGRSTDQVITEKGDFELDLFYDQEYQLRFSKEGFVTKTIVVNTTKIPDTEKALGEFFTNEMHITMIPNKRCLNTDYLDQNPVAIYKYHSASNDITFNETRHQQVLQELENIKAQFDDLEGLDEHLATGDASMRSRKYDDAFIAYEKAIELCGKDEEIIVKRDSADYRKWVTEADNLFKRRDYQKAKQKYKHALGHHAWKGYPQIKINEIDSLLKPIEPPLVDDEEEIEDLGTPEEPEVGTKVSRHVEDNFFDPLEKMQRDFDNQHVEDRTASSSEKYDKIKRLKEQQTAIAQGKAEKAQRLRQARIDSLNRLRNSSSATNVEIEDREVIERSYEEGSKTITERSVRVGDKTIVYKKVESRYGTQYFKEGVAVSEYIWNRDTTSIP